MSGGIEVLQALKKNARYWYAETKEEEKSFTLGALSERDKGQSNNLLLRSGSQNPREIDK